MFELLTIAFFQFFSITAQPANTQVGGTGWGGDATQVGGTGWGGDVTPVGGTGWGGDAQNNTGSGGVVTN